MNDIDKVSQKLGQIEGKIDYTCTKIDEIEEQLPNYSEDEIEDIEEKVEEAHEKAEKHDRWWGWFAKGSGALITLFGAILTTAYDAVIEFLYKVVTGN